MSENKVYQFKITLKYSKPPIWRRIQVPGSFTFDQLHLAIQMSMGWTNSHLYSFEIDGTEITDKSKGFDIPEDIPLNIVDAPKTFIKDYFTRPKQKGLYEYDFGDQWDHVVLFEKSEPAKKEEKYPKCLAGKRACPPEDCGGIDEYEDFLKIISNPSHKEYKDIKEWLERIHRFPFNPEEFSVTKVFDNWN